ncbi:hypothetical protein [Desulfoscipio geothermicus]|uniref:Uncharacterized protein n=1 Tax=Desulfoscipio geothermicus DSM 3669 TaxID=1121426 RepID=A0A1I6EIV7_9FIRM|nr:hypothetical protein [Desulfoscipio geothermicus]SFR17412.1 hypothetical protein SAMN05660706_1474 [Desulfoscipio geothermicus DSM 3669]
MYREKNFDNPLLTEALAKLRMAQNFFNNASTPDMIDAAIYELNVAEMHLRAVIKRARNGGDDLTD